LKRDEYYADFVVLLLENIAVNCGISFRGPGPFAAFSVFNYGCINGSSLAHELGSNMGLLGTIHEDPTPGYNHAFGPCSADIPIDYYTIMANQPFCFNYSQVFYFSNPNITINNVQLGIVGESENYRYLNERREDYANY